MQGSTQRVYDVSSMTDELKRKMKAYGVASVPTTIIDRSMKVVGIPDFPWICGEELYLRLNGEYSLNKHQ